MIMRVVKTWCENTKEGMDYLKYNGYKPVCRLSRKLWLVRCVGNKLDDVIVL
jgi:hypothetical protein